MARNTPAAEPADDFDDLLAEDTGLPESASEDAAPVDNFEDAIAEVEADDEPAELTPEQRRIQELESALAALDEAEAELTPEQKRIAELEALLEDKIAASAGPFVTPVPAEEQGTGEKILFHFKKDGLLVLGNIWLRGQEIEIEVGSPAYQRTIDSRTGVSWLELLDDEGAQYAKWGDHYIGRGPFKPRPDEKFEDEVAREDRQRRRRPIVLSR